MSRVDDPDKDKKVTTPGPFITGDPYADEEFPERRQIRPRSLQEAEAIIQQIEARNQILKGRVAFIQEAYSQQRDEMTGFQKARLSLSEANSIQLASWDEILQGIFDYKRAFKKHKIPWKTLAVTAIAVAFIAMLGAQPQYAVGIQAWLSKPDNQAFFLIVVIMLLIAVWLTNRRRVRRGEM